MVSIKNMENKLILMVLNFFVDILVDSLSINGITIYIRSKPDIPKNNTDLKQIKPFIFPKFNISVL